MKEKKKFILPALISLLIFNISFAVEEPVSEDKGLSLTIEEAVELGLENSIDLEIVRNQIDISALTQKRTKYLSRKLEDGDKKIHNSKKEVNESQELLNEGRTPVDITLSDGTTIKQGTNIDNLEISDEAKEQIKTSIQNKIDSSEDAIESGELSLTESLEDAGTTLSENLKFESLESLSVDSTSDLMTTMADVSYDVTNASYDIYKNQIAMLIQNNYYEVLKDQKILEVKKKAMERGKKQYEFTKDSYEVGMKAKDDMLLADVYYKGTEISYRKAKGELENALTEFKKSLNVPLDTEIKLTDVLIDEREIPDLKEGLTNGLKNRLEIKKTLGEVEIYDLNLESTKGKHPDNTFQYKEAKLLKEKARLNYDKVFQEVEASIRQSYETLMSAGDMMEKAKDMVEKAQESVEIAEYKYKEGFGVETSLLKKLDLESAAGTIVEVLAAEENLSNVEETVVEIIYGYNLAKAKYYNDSGKLIY